MQATDVESFFLPLGKEQGLKLLAFFFLKTQKMLPFLSKIKFYKNQDYELKIKFLLTIERNWSSYPCKICFVV